MVWPKRYEKDKYRWKTEGREGDWNGEKENEGMDYILGWVHFKYAATRSTTNCHSDQEIAGWDYLAGIIWKDNNISYIMTSSNLSVGNLWLFPAAALLLWFPVLPKAFRAQGHLPLLESLPPQRVWLPMPEVSTSCVRKGCGKHPWHSTDTLAFAPCTCALAHALPI